MQNVWLLLWHPKRCLAFLYRGFYCFFPLSFEKKFYQPRELRYNSWTQKRKKEIQVTNFLIRLKWKEKKKIKEQKIHRFWGFTIITILQIWSSIKIHNARKEKIICKRMTNYKLSVCFSVKFQNGRLQHW